MLWDDKPQMHKFGQTRWWKSENMELEKSWAERIGKQGAGRGEEDPKLNPSKKWGLRWTWGLVWGGGGGGRTEGWVEEGERMRGGRGGERRDSETWLKCLLCWLDCCWREWYGLQLTTALKTLQTSITVHTISQFTLQAEVQVLSHGHSTRCSTHTAHCFRTIHSLYTIYMSNRLFCIFHTLQCCWKSCYRLYTRPVTTYSEIWCRGKFQRHVHGRL